MSVTLKKKCGAYIIIDYLLRRKREGKRNKRMDIQAEIIKQELEPQESIVSVKIECENEDIPTGHVKTETHVDIENQINKILTTTIKEEFDKVDMCETNTKKETVVLRVKEELSSEREEDEIDLDTLPEIKTEELMLKNESDYSETGKREIKKNRMDIQTAIIKQELEPKESIVSVKTDCENEDIPTGHIKTERDVDIENQINKILGTTLKEEFDKVDMYLTNTKKETLVPGVKEEPSSEMEEVEIDLDSLPKIKTEELMLKNESDNSETGAHRKNHMRGDIITKIDRNPIKSHCCQFCDYRTLHKCNLKYHIMTKHDKNSIKRYGCDRCNYGTHLKSDLAKHILVRHDKTSVKKHRCTLCDYGTHSKSNLKTHVMIKHDKSLIKQHGCDLCDYRAYSKSTLKRHIMMKHDKNANKQHCCDLCDYRSHIKGNLKTHILLMHNKNSIKQHGCDLCDYKTHIKGHLKTHRMVKHDMNSFKKYGCNMCDYRAYKKYDLKRHLIKRHKLNSQPILLKHDVNMEKESSNVAS